MKKNFYKLFAAVLALIALVGFIDSTYLTVKHYQGQPVICSVLEGCDKVTSSQYATVGVVPVALLGMVYYFGIFSLALLSLFLNNTRRYLQALVFIAPIGFLASLWFVYIQFFVIKAICFYCMISAATSTLIFLLVVYFLILNRIRSNNTLNI